MVPRLLIDKRLRSNEAKHFFFKEIVINYNFLSVQVINNKTIESLKKNLIST